MLLIRSAFLFVLSMSPLHAAPPNDSFAARIDLTGASLTTAGTNIGATIETGEPNHGVAYSRTGGKSIWWTWTAPFAGAVTVTDLANFNHLLATYSGGALTNLSLVDSDYNSSGYGATATFDTLAGGTYQIAVDGQSGASGTNLLTLTLLPPPPNDNFADRIVLTGANVTTNGSNVAATKEPGEPNHAGYIGGRSVWWTWTAPVGGRVLISVGGDFRKAIAIYTGTALASLTPVADAANFTSTAATASLDAVAGVTYQIAVEGAKKADFTTNLTVTVATLPPPANDNFADAATLTGTNFTLSAATNTSATLEAGEPLHAGRTGGCSVWWNWTAPVSGHFVVLVDGYFNKLLGVYTGNSASALTGVTSGYGTTNNPAQAGFDATVGTVYHLAVDGENGVASSFSIEFRLPPLNDDFANRFTLVGTNLSVIATNTLATKEAGEPNHAADVGGKSLWWTWTAPLAGRVMVMVTNASIDPIVAVYSGTDLASLTTNASGSAYSPGPAYATFDALPGMTYQIAVDGRYDNGGTLTLRLAYVTPPPSDFFADRMAVTNTATPNVFFVTGSNLGATKEAGETWWGTASVWWAWTAPTNGEMLVELETSGNGALTYPWLNLFTGTNLATQTRIVPRIEWAGQKYYHDARFVVTAGTTYSIWVANRSGVQGTYTLRGTFEPPPANDNFNNRVTLTNTPTFFQYGYVTVNSYNVCATKEAGEPWHGGATYYNFGGKSVWWTWTAPYSGRISVAVRPIRYAYTSAAGLYTGTAVNSLARITNSYSTCTDGSTSLNAAVTAGTTYQIVADGGDTGEFYLDLYAYLDTNAPSVTITNPLPGQATNSTLVVSGTATDPLGTGAFRYASGVNLVEVRLNGGAWLPATGTNAWSRALTLANGMNLLEVRARDSLSNYSAIASVTATYGTLLSGVQLVAGRPQMTCLSVVGKTYALEWTDSLPPLLWTPVLAEPIPGTGSPLTLTDTNPLGGLQRFYRLRVQ